MQQLLVIQTSPSLWADSDGLADNPLPATTGLGLGLGLTSSCFRARALPVCYKAQQPHRDKLKRKD